MDTREQIKLVSKGLAHYYYSIMKEISTFPYTPCKTVGMETDEFYNQYASFCQCLNTKDLYHLTCLYFSIYYPNDSCLNDQALKKYSEYFSLIESEFEICQPSNSQKSKVVELKQASTSIRFKSDFISFLNSTINEIDTAIFQVSKNSIIAIIILYILKDDVDEQILNSLYTIFGCEICKSSKQDAVLEFYKEIYDYSPDSCLSNFPEHNCEFFLENKASCVLGRELYDLTKLYLVFLESNGSVGTTKMVCADIYDVIHNTYKCFFYQKLNLVTNT